VKIVAICSSHADEVRSGDDRLMIMTCDEIIWEGHEKSYLTRAKEGSKTGMDGY